jgi:hypothetical protein
MRNFWRFVALRQEAYWRRQRGEGPPYSDDPALSRYHFCNVYREADRGTIFYQKMRVPTDELSGVELLQHEIWQSTTYRLINRIDTFEAYGQLPSLDDAGAILHWLDFLKARMDAGEKVFTGRHLNRGFACYKATLEALWDPYLFEVALAVHEADTLRQVCKAVATIPNVGPFFAWQIVCDLLESGVLPTYDDAETFTVLGPGALAGARLVDVDPFTGGPFAPKSELLEVARRLVDVQETCLSEQGLTLVPPPQAPGRMRLKNVEHALCEYARYVRASDPSKNAGLEVKPWAR